MDNKLGYLFDNVKSVAKQHKMKMTQILMDWYWKSFKSVLT